MKTRHILLAFLVALALGLGMTVLAQTSGTGQLFYNQSIPGNTVIPDGLKSLIMQYYPQAFTSGWGSSDYACHPEIPIQDDLTNGRIQCWEQELSSSGPDVYVVTYSRCGETLLRIFVKDASGTYHYLWGANPDVFGGTLWDPHFEDVENDGMKDILLYWEDDSYNTGATVNQGVLVLAYRNGAIVPITPYNPQNGAAWVMGPPAPGNTDAYTCTCSDSGVGFVDIDGDGIPELLVYPDYGPAGNRVWLGGTEVWKLVNGVYQFQYETPIGTTTPSGGVIGAAIKPASIPLGELQGAGGNTSVKGKSQGGGNDQAITLYVMPPSGFTLDDVDWTSLRIADFTQAPTADEGVTPAPYSATSPPATMMPVSRFGQTMLQEDLSKPDMSFTQQDADPVYTIGPSGRLHFTTPYHVFGFSKTLLLPWLYQQWQNGASSSPLTTCVSPGQSSSSARKGGTKAGSQTPPASKAAPAKPAGTKGPATKAQPESQGNPHCFAPITIPIRVNLTNNRGPALGEARIWIDTGAQGSSSAAADAGGTKQLTGRKARADSAK
ncbi:MAG: FG-GAP repeat domain-containing protein [Acidobacteriota bacterium]